MFNFREKIESLRADEYGHLNQKIYLDHAANTIYMKSLIHDYYVKLTQNLFSNPHSNSESGIYTQNYVSSTREKVLALFRTNVNEYDCVFVSNASSGFKLIGEVFEFGGEGAVFAYLNDNHTSVIGLREVAWSKGCQVYCVYEQDGSGELNAQLVGGKSDETRARDENRRNLFVYPAQSNFNGRKYPLEWVQDAGSCLKNIETTSPDWFVCLDAASYVCTSVLDLSNDKPDFVCLSFYKIFGFPTGLGAVLIRKSDRMKTALRKSYFGGGTIAMALVNEPVFEFRRGNYHEFMEDGTISYLDIIAVNLAINKFSKLFNGDTFMHSIEAYVQQVAEFCVEKITALKHYNGVSLVELYRKSDAPHGPILAFNLKDSKEKYISYVLVNKLAQESGVQLRVGCFCNIGACKMHLKNLDLLENYQLFGHKCGDHIDLINGLPTGAIRVSFGYCSIQDDVEKFIQFLSENFIDSQAMAESSLTTGEAWRFDKQYFKLVKMFIYPIKSCAPFEIETSWPLCSRTNSLMYDRHWIIVDASQIPLTQKRLPVLTDLHVNISLSENTLELRYKESSFKTSLELNEEQRVVSNHVSVCTHKINGFDCGDEVAEWLKKQFEIDYDCRLIKLDGDSCDAGTKSTFNNQADYLLITVNSIRKLRKYLLNSLHMEITDHKLLFNIDNQLVSQFRANFVVEVLGNEEENVINEELWKVIKIDDVFKFQVTSLCTRCQMINISQKNESSSSVNKQVFAHLLKELYKFKANSKFGIYLTKECGGVAVGEDRLAIGMIGVAYNK